MFVADTGHYYEDPAEGTSGLKINQKNQCRLILYNVVSLIPSINIFIHIKVTAEDSYSVSVANEDLENRSEF